MASETVHDANQRDTDEAHRLALLDLQLASSRLARLLKTAFRDGDGAVGRFDHLCRKNGDEDAVAIAQGRGSMPRALWFGRRRGGWLDPTARKEANAALRELEEAALHRRAARNRVEDLAAVRALAAKQRERDERDRATDRPRITGRGSGRT